MANKVEVVVTKKFKDSKNKLVVRDVGEVLKVTQARANVLIDNDVAELVVKVPDESLDEESLDGDGTDPE